MPKFKIEMELTSINERILLTDFDSNNKNINGITFNENLSEEENGLYRLNFSIAEEFGRKDKINIGSLISVGRPIWLHIYNPSKSIRMVISSFSPVIGPENTIYDIEAQDYASYAFARNNAGLTLDTIGDEDFEDWMKQRSIAFPPKIKNIADHILQRGWLQKFNGTDGWSVVVDTWVPSPNPDNLRPKSAITLNFETSNTNTYSALVSLAQLSNTFLEFDYINEVVYFIDKESLELDKNYTLKRDFNLQNFGLSYNGENLYSIFYIEGGEDEFGLATILSDATNYKDNFLFNFNYFKDRKLVPNNNVIDNEINTNLRNINIEFQQTIRDRFNALGLIRSFETDLNLLGDALMLAEEDKSNNYSDILKIFKTRRSDVDGQETRTFTTPYFTATWATIPTDIDRENLEFDFPVTLRYNNSEITTLQASILNPLISEEFQFEGLKFVIGFDSSLDQEPGFVEGIRKGNTFYYKVIEGTFDIEELRIISSRARYSESVSWSQLKIIYPYFSKLDLFDGQTAINEARERWQFRVDFVKDLWKEDIEYIACLVDSTDPSCERFWIPTDTSVREDLQESIAERINDYKIAIGEYDPEEDELDENRLGKFTIILSIFDQFASEYQLLNSQKSRIMGRYRSIQNQKQEFWYNLKKDRQHVFVEGYYENSIETTPESLKEQAEAIYIDYQKPSEDFSITYIDVSDLVGINLEAIKPGDFVTLQEDKLKIQQNETSKLKVASISKVLRDKANINLTIYRHNMINTILEKIIAKNQ